MLHLIPDYCCCKIPVLKRTSQRPVSSSLRREERRHEEAEKGRIPEVKDSTEHAPWARKHPKASASLSFLVTVKYASILEFGRFFELSAIHPSKLKIGKFKQFTCKVPFLPFHVWVHYKRKYYITEEPRVVRWVEVSQHRGWTRLLTNCSSSSDVLREFKAKNMTDVSEQVSLFYRSAVEILLHEV